MRQVQREKLDRASRLLLGALIEAYDVLSQLQAEVGSEVQENRHLQTLREYIQDDQPRDNIDNRNQEEKSEARTIELTCDSPAERELKAGSVAAEESGEEETDHQTDGQKEVSLPDIVPVITTQQAIPDIIVSSRKTPKISSCRVRKTKPRFRLSTLNELQRTKRSWTGSQNMSWKEVGSRLNHVSQKWQKSPTQARRRRRSNSDVTRNDQEPDTRPCLQNDQTDWSPPPPAPVPASPAPSHQDSLFNNVLKVVQVFGLYLIVKKFENILK